MKAPPSDSRLANQAASLIHGGVDDYMGRFSQITRRAPARFQNLDWAGGQRDALLRLDLYVGVVDRVTAHLQQLMDQRSQDRMLWAAIKAVYSAYITDRDDREVAETFYNSVTRRVFHTVGVDKAVEFVDSDFTEPPAGSSDSVFFTLKRRESTARLVEDILNAFGHFGGYRSRREDALEAASRIDARLDELGAQPVVGRAEIVSSVFYRGTAAYIVGLLYSGSLRVPLVIALRNGHSGVFIDAVLLTEDDVSILFSFTRAYFHTEFERPYDLVRFLALLMPRKQIAELYMSIGLHKHGKTELYRELSGHLAGSSGMFEHASGIPGLVMIVFTMPGLDYVFKVIRDSFPASKQTTRAKVINKYRLVFHHDRAGRLIDAHDFQHLKFKRDRFGAELAEELLGEAADSVRVEGDSIVINHLYIERRVVPLDVYAREATETEASRAVIDYGQAVKDLASANIFPGDLLTKNFGVTRHGRVVFYDYDEISPLVEIRFRPMPEPKDDYEAMSDEPWFAAGPKDVFPEEHEVFLGVGEDLARIFKTSHGDLFEVGPWVEIQRRVKAGELLEVAAYADRTRLANAARYNSW